MRALFNAKTRLLIGPVCIALMLIACSAVDSFNRSGDPTPFAGTAPTTTAAGAGAAPGAQTTAVQASVASNPRSSGSATNPAAMVYAQAGPSVVNITSLAIVRTRETLQVLLADEYEESGAHAPNEALFKEVERAESTPTDVERQRQRLERAAA
jgi:hypothetical protein